MKYLEFEIENYRAIEKPLKIDLTKSNLIPLVGINECGKTTILQAIYCFDSNNDLEYNGKHLEDTKNLYNTVDKKPSMVRAKIKISYDDLENDYEVIVDYLISEKLDQLIERKKNLIIPPPNEEQIKQIKREMEQSDELSNYSEKFDKFPLKKKDYPGYIQIERNLNTQKYRLTNWPEGEQYDDSFHHFWGDDIVSTMPFILYNDDFMDRPPSSIKIPKTKPYLSGWLGIYEQLFKSTSSDYSIFKAVEETDSRRRGAILSDVQDKLNQTLSKAWKTFLLSKHESINIKLDIQPNSDPEDAKKFPFILDIKVVEKLENKERLFNVTDRSKGFLWFFNFVMKLEFNHKINGEVENTIHLLDEPGSYLHYTAQEKLCQKLVDISKRHGIVIYCTHSHTLLNPEMIPLNSIYIVEKNKSKKIIATPLPQAKARIENTNAYQPILDALQISAYSFNPKGKKIILVEGIYDKYAIELFIKLSSDIAVLPGTNADSIVKNIPLMIVSEKPYVAIWDNDEEGNRHYKKAIKEFGPIESEKMDLLPNLKGGNRRMEEMFDRNDLEIIKEKLNLEKSANYERIICTLYLSSNSIKASIINKISNLTKDNFAILDRIIQKRFQIKS